MAEALAAAAQARALEHDAAARSLQPALRALREQVLRARHAATTVSALFNLYVSCFLINF